MIYEQNYLMHHGVKGQKWGLRRFQNEDGTLTAEGRARYGDTPNTGDHGAKRVFGSEHGIIYKITGNEHPGKERAQHLAKRQNKLEQIRDTRKSDGEDVSKLDNKIEKIKKQKEIQSMTNANLEAYRKHNTTSKLFWQNMNPLMNAHTYRKHVANGEKPSKAFVKAMAAEFIPYYWIHDMKKSGY